MAAVILRVSLLLCLAVFATAAAAEPLTIHVGESWAFAIKDGQPARAHRVKPAAKPGRGEIKASVTPLGGTTMTLTNNSATSYTFRAELVGVQSKVSARTCTLPANSKPALEYWPQKAAAVRLSNFRATADPGNCPKPGN
jgi:hypothetical protein